MFLWKHAYSNATITRIDQLENNGEYAAVELVVQRVSNAQKTITKLLADSIYDEAGGSTKRLTGLRACCNETTTTAYGDIQEADISQWEGKRNSTTESMELDVLRTLCSDAKIYDGPMGKPDLIVSTETLFNVVVAILQLQQRFTKDERTAKAGFTGVEFEGKSFFPDDYCPSGWAFAVNSNFYGFAVHTQGYFTRTKWEKIPSSAEDKAMKLLFDGNSVCSNRKAHKAHENLS